MPQVTVHDVDVFYRDEGAGPAIILGHSSTGSSGQWRGLMHASPTASALSRPTI